VCLDCTAQTALRTAEKGEQPILLTLEKRIHRTLHNSQHMLTEKQIYVWYRRAFFTGLLFRLVQTGHSVRNYGFVVVQTGSNLRNYGFVWYRQGVLYGIMVLSGTYGTFFTKLWHRLVQTGRSLGNYGIV
jgi:hypothetical protein